MSTPHFQHQQMHRQAVQSAQQAHQQAAASARRAGGPMGPTTSPSMRWNGGSPSRGPFSLVAFLFKVVLLVGIVALAITFGPQLVDRAQEQVDTGTETPAPQGP